MIEDLLAANEAWARAKTSSDPDFFLRLSAQQSPEYLWIGCSDSRVPANDIVGRDPGEMFVHRNVANLCTPSDINFLSVLQYAVEVLKVRRILVVGHYGCGGVLASLDQPTHGLVDHWLGPIRGLVTRSRAELDALPDGPARQDRLVELNVIYQAALLNDNPIVVNARAGGHAIGIHGWVYSLKNGLVTDLHVPVPPDAVDPGPSPRRVAMESAKAPAPTAEPTPNAGPAPSKKRGLFGRSL